MSDIPPQYAAYPRPSDPRTYKGPPDFRIEAISEAWVIFKSDVATWALGVLLMAIIVSLIQMPAIILSFVSSMNAPYAGPSVGVQAVNLVGGVLAAGVFVALQGGLFRIIFLRMKLVHEGIGGIFNADGQGFKLFQLGVLMALPNSVASIAFALMTPAPQPNDPFAGLGIVVGLMGAIVLINLCLFPFFLTPAILVDQKLSLKEALALSWKTVTRNYARGLAFYFVVNVASVLGVLLCGVGIIFSAPLLYLSIAVAYRDYFIPSLDATGSAGSFEGPKDVHGPTTQ